MKFSVEAEVHEIASESLQLAVLGLGSVALVTSLAFALLGGEAGFATSGSIQTASLLVIACLAATAVGLFAVSAKPRPGRFTVEATGDELKWGKRRKATSSLRDVLVLPGQGDWVVEATSRFGSCRIHLEERGAAERLAGVLTGKAVPAASLRMRKKASYEIFVTTISMWVLVYGAICALPQLPIAGALLLGLFLPVALWVSLRALPAQVIVREDTVLYLHPLSRVTYPREEIERLHVSDDDCLEITLKSGTTVSLPDLIHHHRDGIPSGGITSPAKRLATAFEQVEAGAP